MRRPRFGHRVFRCRISSFRQLDSAARASVDFKHGPRLGWRSQARYLLHGSMASWRVSSGRRAVMLVRVSSRCMGGKATKLMNISNSDAMGVLGHSTWGIWAPASLRFLGVRAILQLELARLFGHAKRSVGVGFEVGCGCASGLRSAVRRGLTAPSNR